MLMIFTVQFCLLQLHITELDRFRCLFLHVRVGYDAKINCDTYKKYGKGCQYIKLILYIRIRIPCIQEQGHPSLSPHGVALARARYRLRHLSGALFRHNALVLFFVLPFADRRADVVFHALHGIWPVSSQR